MVDGDPKSPVLIVGMAPGREELAANRPFVGGSGRLLWSMMKRAGWNRQDCFIVNTIGEWPEKADGNPSQAQLERYWDAFEDAVCSSEARVAICLGGAALDRFTGIVTADKLAKRKSGIEKWRGYLVAPSECGVHTRTMVRMEQYKTSTKLHKKGDPKLVKHKVAAPVTLPPKLEWIIPTLHPAGVMRSGLGPLPALAADTARSRRVVEGTLRLSNTIWGTEPGSGPALGSAVSIDIETRRAANIDIIVRVGVAYSGWAWSREWDQVARDAVAKIVAVPENIALFHNMQYDVPLLEAEGIEFKCKFIDTMMLASTLQPDLYKGLNSVIPLYLDTQRHKHLSDEQPALYNALDAIRTLELLAPMESELKRTGQTDWFRNRVMPGMRVLINMSRRGIPVDAARKEAWLKDLTIQSNEAQERWAELVPHVPPGSNKRVAEYVYEELGLPRKLGKRGNYTVDAGTLKDLIGWTQRQNTTKWEGVHEQLTTLLKFREVDKLRSTYASFPLGDDGRIHPSYLPAAKDDDDGDFGKGLAGTGRITSRNPNIQNQPPAARKIFVPPSGAHVLIEADYSQLELRIAAALSQDEGLLEALKGDVHAHTMALLNCDRVRAKNLIYGSLYGAGPRKLCMVLRAKGYNISEQEAKALQDALAAAYPKLWRWRQRVINEAGTTYQLTTPFGQKRYFFAGRAAAPAAIDFLPQGTGAGITWCILPELEDRTQAVGAELLNLVHDSALTAALKARLAETIGVIKDVMEQPWDCIAPGFMVPVTIKTSESSWGEMKEWTL